jgi:hypothetical protein
MSTNEIADIIIKNLRERQFPIFLTSFAGRGFSEADVLGINRNGYIYEYEIKRSRSDFFADFKNKTYKHRNLKDRNATHTYDAWKNGKRTGDTYELILIPNRFFYVCEKGLISINEVPEYAGLIYVQPNGSMDEMVMAKQLHKNKANVSVYQRVAEIMCQRSVYGCSYYKHVAKLSDEKHF